MGDSDRCGGSSVEVNRQDWNKSNEKGDKMTK